MAIYKGAQAHAHAYEMDCLHNRGVFTATYPTYAKDISTAIAMDALARRWRKGHLLMPPTPERRGQFLVYLKWLLNYDDEAEGKKAVYNKRKDPNRRLVTAYKRYTRNGGFLNLRYLTQLAQEAVNEEREAYLRRRFPERYAEPVITETPSLESVPA